MPMVMLFLAGGAACTWSLLLVMSGERQRRLSSLGAAGMPTHMAASALSQSTVNLPANAPAPSPVAAPKKN
jgi:hypothetical protein